MKVFSRFKFFLHLALLYCSRIITEKRRWYTAQDVTDNRAKVFYGHNNIPSRMDRSGGAIIKLQDLDDAFPNTIRGANILYLVSSAMPIFASVMVKEAKRRGVIFVLNQNGVAYPAWHGPGWEKTNQPKRFLLESADYVIYQSEFCKISADRFLGSCKVPCTVLPNPVDTSVFTPVYGKPPGCSILLAGSHQHFYRISTALKMMKYLQMKVPDMKLTIAGRYAWRKSEKKCIEEALNFAHSIGVANQVEFRGGYSQEEASSLFQEHHILLHTKYNDPCPRLVVEAMACGLPIVYSQSGGMMELVGKEGGIGVEAPLDWDKVHPPDPQRLAPAVIDVFLDYERFSNAVRTRSVEKFDVRPWIEKHRKIFDSLLLSSM